MDLPRIVAIADVHLDADWSVAPRMETFYTDRLGMQRLADTPRDTLVFRAFPRSGPRLIVHLTESPLQQRVRRDAVIQVASLAGWREELEDANEPHEWIQGFSLYDRRLLISDPAGNLLELVEQHPL